MKKYTLFIALVIFLDLQLLGQKGGESTYNFLNLTNSARIAALGGRNVSLYEDDINLTFHNPALLTADMNQDLTLNYVNYFAGINFGYASYAFTKEGIGNFAAGMHYVDYGNFERTDEFGQIHGTFRASEYALNLIYSRALIDTILNIGVNLKPVFSVFEQYTSLGVALDIGISWHNPVSNTSAGLVIKNFGTQILTYTGNREKLPFEIQAGFTQGLAHAPFRFNITLQNLERWDLTYQLEEDDFFTSVIDQPQKSKFDIFGDKLMRHFIFGVEFLAGKNFHVDLGYNYKRRAEMKSNMYPGLVGFSFGFGFKISRFHFAYGRSSYHLAGGTNHISLVTSLSEFYQKK